MYLSLSLLPSLLPITLALLALALPVGSGMLPFEAAPLPSGLPFEVRLASFCRLAVAIDWTPSLCPAVAAGTGLMLGSTGAVGSGTCA